MTLGAEFGQTPWKKEDFEGILWKFLQKEMGGGGSLAVLAKGVALCAAPCEAECRNEGRGGLERENDYYVKVRSGISSCLAKTLDSALKVRKKG